MNQVDSSLQMQQIFMDYFSTLNATHYLLLAFCFFSVIIILIVGAILCYIYKRKCNLQFDVKQLRVMNRKYREQIAELELVNAQLNTQQERLQHECNTQTHTIRRLKAETTPTNEQDVQNITILGEQNENR